MLFPSLETDINTSGIHMNPDTNDLYVLKKCIIWLHRHIRRYPCFDSETLKLLCWLLGTEMQELGKFLLSQFEIDNRIRFEEEIAETALDPYDFSQLMIKLLRESKSVTNCRFWQHASRLLKKKLASQQFQKKSEIEKNIIALRNLFELNDKETELCTFMFVANTYSYAEEYFISHIECHRFAGQKYLANILGVNKKELHTTIYGKLTKIGLYEVDKWGISPENEFLNLIQNPSDQNFTKKFYEPVPKSTVSLNNFLIEKDHTGHILNLFKTKANSPTHILLYGPPGTGKTSFAYSLLDQIKTPAYEIARGEDNTTKHRRASIIACLTSTNFNQCSIVLVDEADNLLNTQNSWLMNGETQDKGWLNHLLDQPGTRMIWVTNRIDSIEDSVLRRFAFSLPFKPFNQSQRVLLWDSILRKNKCKTYCSQAEIINFAKKYDVNAGVIDLATRKAIENAPSSKINFLNTVKMTLESHQTLVNNGEELTNKDAIEKNYSIDGLNVDGDLNAMFKQLETFDAYLRNEKQHHIMNMNLLFYGPSGTGKSELARYMANRLDRKIICKRISDLQSKYVGEGEKNIKRAFQEAESEEAVFIIDEADSLLFSRDRAKHSWEISFTNEFLTQMERYRGILVCTTNRLDDLDIASLRRFNHKIGFEYLTAKGNLLFYDLLLKPLCTDMIDSSSLKELKQTENLAPGDFKLVRNRYSFHPKNDIKHA
ncbi:MAG: AAA family ATPase, partial [Desulfobacterales bacterium]|uniref:AAA family ATPase n=1 Tax=Desulfosarcina sp. TaxID=2027861 RepID=UPI0029B5866F